MGVVHERTKNCEEKMVNVDKPRWCEMTKTTIKPRWCGCEDERNKTYEEKKENYRK